jgi:hypothetical protein
MARLSPWLRGLVVGLLLALAWPAEVGVYLDKRGAPLLSDRAPEGATPIEPEALRLRWKGRLLEPEPLELERGGSDVESSDQRELRAAYADIRRGELRRALAALGRLARGSAVQSDAALLFARVELHRGRLEPARAALLSVLEESSPRALELRPEVERLLAEIDVELAHAQAKSGADAEQHREASEHYTLIYDHRFAGRDFGARLLSSLEQVRAELQTQLGRALARPLDVYLYTRAQYLENYQHRFGFATVGFYDGAIHAVSTRQPRQRLKALLAHEHTHALFLDALRSHQPFFLNEGIAEREEERVLGRPQLADEEWRELVDALRSSEWIPLGRLIPGFAGLDGRRARLAYLESRAAVELISRRPQALANWLRRCADGEPWESALRAETGWGVPELDEALGAEVRGRFSELPGELRVSPR